MQQPKIKKIEFINTRDVIINNNLYVRRQSFVTEHENGLIAKEKKGREVMLTLTKKGLEVGTKLKAIHKILTGIDNKQNEKNSR